MNKNVTGKKDQCGEESEEDERSIPFISLSNIKTSLQEIQRLMRDDLLFLAVNERFF